MDGTETDIAIYLTVDGKVFIAPQFDIGWEKNEGGTCPDFVALDFSCKEIVVVEVTSAANWKPLASKVSDREMRWFSPTRGRLQQAGVTDGNWRIRFLGFVRNAALEGIRVAFAGKEGVTFHAIEDATFIWAYWDERIKFGLPGNGRHLRSGSTP
jgi:hypothetical protein